MRRTLAAGALFLLVVACGRSDVVGGASLGAREPSTLESRDQESLGQKQRACGPGFGDCDGKVANGCETNLRSEINCGACGNRCAPGHRCAETTPGAFACKAVRHCDAGLADCDGSPQNGCETNLAGSVNHCGACGNVCTVANGTPTCASGACAIASCNSGYTRHDGSCIPTVIDCTFDRGTGTRTWDAGAGAYDACVASACVAGYVVSDGACIPSVVTCVILHGTGTQTWNGSSYGACTATACDASYVLSANSCVPESRNCTVSNGSGTQVWDAAAGAYGACAAASCDAGFAVSQDICIPTVQSCPVSHGAGTETWNATAGAYGACTVTSCDSEYVRSANTCIPAVVNCSVPNGTGTQTWNGTEYGSCTATSCDANHSLSNGQCVGNVVNCSLEHGTGTQTWSAVNGAYGACVATACDAGYTLGNGACIAADGSNGTVRTVSGAVLPIAIVPCGDGTTTRCSLATAEHTCTAIGKKLVSHAADATAPYEFSLGATSSCRWSISYFTNHDPAIAGRCLVGVSNARWSACCGPGAWHGHTVTVPTLLGQQFGYVEGSESGYSAALSNVTGTTWGCLGTSAAPPERSGCGTYYVACR